MRKALKLTNGPTDPSHAEVARALLDAADLLEAGEHPGLSTAEDMRTLLRERLMPHALSELTALERRRGIKTV